MTPLLVRRCAAWASGLIWSTSLLLPSYATPIETIGGGDPLRTDVLSGWGLFFFGWLGPMEANDPVLAWYANPALIWCIWRLATPKALSHKTLVALAATVIVGVALACSGLRPTHIEFGDDHGVNGESYPLIGAYVWLGSFVPVLVAIGWESWRYMVSANTTARVLDEFDRLVQEADRLENDYLSRLSDREAVHEAALVLVLNRPQMRHEFALRFEEMLHNNDLELFEYCMHELRWPEVKEKLSAAFHQANDSNDFRARDYFRGVLTAFEDDWIGRNFYERFSK